MLMGFYQQGHPTLAAIVLATTQLGPLFQIAALLYMLVPMRAGRQAPGTGNLFRFLTHVRPWTLVEVFSLRIRSMHTLTLHLVLH